MLTKANLNTSVLSPNELLDGYVRLPVVEKTAIKSLTMTRNIIVNGQVLSQSSPINEKEISTLEEIWDLYSKDEESKRLAALSFMKEWDSYSSLKNLRVWWDNLSFAFDITHVGTVLAHTNARRCDNTIPELPLVT